MKSTQNVHINLCTGCPQKSLVQLVCMYMSKQYYCTFDVLVILFAIGNVYFSLTNVHFSDFACCSNLKRMSYYK